MAIAYVDAFNGASGDMLLGALTHAGADPETLIQTLKTLPLEFGLSFSDTMRGGIKALKANVDAPVGHHHRGLSDVISILRQGKLAPRALERAERVFNRLAMAEAKVHGTTVEKIHFHEVGAVDAIVDIAGVCQALELLNIDEITASALPLGNGTVRCAHGLLPVPAPAVVELMQGFPVYDNGQSGELVTPTGAAILTTLATFGPKPEMTLLGTGYGSGTREDQGLPNLLRVMIGEARPNTDRIAVIETNLDDMNPQFYEHLMERLFEAGALDVTLTPTYMKRNRPGTVVSVIVSTALREKCCEILLAESTAIGVRTYEATRRILERRHETVETPYGTIRIKVSTGGGARNVMPEYRDCLELAQKTQRPLKEIWMAAVIAAGG